MTVVFGRQIKSSDIHDKLSRRRKKREESLNDYVYEMEFIASQVGLTEDVVRGYIARGFTDDVHASTVLATTRSRDQFMELLEEYERRSLSFSEGPPKKDNSKKKCYVCYRIGHIGRDCPSNPEKSAKPNETNKHQGTTQRASNGALSGPCYICHEQGHLAPTCPRNRGKGAIPKRSPAKVNHVQSDEDEYGESPSQINHVQYESRNRSCIIATVGGEQLCCQIDSGAERNIMREDFYRRIAHKYFPDGERVTLRGSGGPIATLGNVVVPTVLCETTYFLKFTIVGEKHLPSQVLIGDPLLDTAEITLRREGPLVVPIICDAYVQLIQEELEFNDEIDIAVNRVAEPYRNQVREMLKSYSPEIPMETAVKLHVKIKDQQPVASRPRRLSPGDEAEVKQQINEWLEKGIIKPATSEYASPLVVTRRKNGRVRICIDYKRLNKIVEREHHPMPLIEDAVDSTADSVIHKVLDLKDGFFHVEVAEDSQKYLSIVTPWGQYVPTKAPFGFCNSPSAFLRFLQWIFRKLIEEGIIVLFMDDMFILARNYLEALKRLERVLNLARKYGLRFNWKKCFILQRKVEFLGYIIEEGTITPAHGKVEALLSYPEPKNQKQLQRLLGLTGYFRKFIRKYAAIAKPLSDLLRKNARFAWGASQQDAFLQLKQALTQAPILHLYRPDRYTELHTDASKEGYGSVLLQKCPKDGEMHPVYYMSRKTKPEEKNYHSYELETLAIVRSLEKFAIYLQGIPFVIVTDCSALQLTLNNKELKSKFARWEMFIEMFNYKIEHRSASKMQHVDALSRRDCILLVRDPLKERIERAQQRDERLKTIKLLLERGPYKNYVLDSGLIFEEKDGHRLLVVPKSMRLEIIQRAHEIGHFGAKKTIEKLKENYSIDKIKKHVDNFIDNCITCILCTRKQGKQEGFLKSIPKEGEPFHTWHVDHIGPLPSTSKNYNHVLTITDAFTKYTWIFATKSKGTR